jgi:tripeptidyl-peptidase-1
MIDSITQSRSIGCQGVSLSGLASPVIPNAGWSAVKGWDPVTGWGTPLFDKMMGLSLGDVHGKKS